MTKSTGERQYRACIRCRARKIKCDLQSISEAGKPPCLKCYSDGADCALAGSRRGGNYAHQRRVNGKKAPRPTGRQADQSPNRHAQRGIPSFEGRENLERSGEPSQDPTGGSIQNPFEALQILVQAASDSSPAAESSAKDIDAASSDRALQNGKDCEVARPALESYEPVANGALGIELIVHLLQFYAERYHHFMPLAPAHVLSTGNVHRTAVEEPFLLTAILTVSSKDRKELEAVHKAIWTHMQSLLLRITLGASDVRNVGAVEGLLLLAEWVPHVSRGIGGSSLSSIAEDEEASAAWTLVGLAVRQGYLLHLDNYSFRIEVNGESKSVTNRNRLAWTFTYLLDRQISIRMGQAFWCRGPGSSARFTVEDYPTLLPKYAFEDDYAAVLQAQVDITTLFGNIHDILYASKRRTLELMLMGDYTKYLDDSDRALAAWKDTWGKLNVSSHLRCLLELQYEYLRLYVCAFAFQAVICRARDRSSPTSQSAPKKPIFFLHGTMASPDSRYIYLATDAAKNLLKIVNDRIDPECHLRYLPVRFYLYEIYSAVFLFKAYTFRAISEEEHQHSAALVRTFISRLETAATCERHVAFRYSKLLACLWFQKADSDARNPQRASESAAPAMASGASFNGGDSHGIKGRPTNAEHVFHPEGPLVDNFNLDIGLLGVPPGASFVFNDPALSLSGGHSHESLTFPGISLPGLNGADLSSLLPVDSYWPQ